MFVNEAVEWAMEYALASANQGGEYIELTIVPPHVELDIVRVHVPELMRELPDMPTSGMMAAPGCLSLFTKPALPCHNRKLGLGESHLALGEIVLKLSMQ